MPEKTLMEFLEEWRTGAALVVGTALSGVVLAIALASLDVPFGRPIGFLGGAVLAFLSFSYVLYGR